MTAAQRFRRDVRGYPMWLVFVVLMFVLPLVFAADLLGMRGKP